VNVRAALLAAVLLVAAAGCRNDFAPRSILADLRVLAIEATPSGRPESVSSCAPAGAARRSHDRRALVLHPLLDRATVGYACAVPECEVELSDPAGTPSGDRVVGVAVTANTSERAEECLALLTAGGGSLPAGVPSSLPQKVELVFRYAARASDGESREAVQLVPFYPGGAPSPRNRPPAIELVEIGGQRVADGDTGPPPGARSRCGSSSTPGARTGTSTRPGRRSRNPSSSPSSPRPAASTSTGRTDPTRASR
jgi:hypothetical protein